MAEPVDIILLSYNRLDYLAEMVSSLEDRTRWPHRLTIVDNASGPETRQWLRDHRERFHQIIWNERNEHLAGLQRGIEATSSELFVLSDADLVVSEPTDAGCWLERLVALAGRHPDFALLGVRLDSRSEARNAHLDDAALIDGELLEGATGVWLNLIRRSALRVPYISDGITSHALRRGGHRVGVAADIYATHRGDGDPQRHPDYLARKQAASGWSTTYPHYPEIATATPPPTLEAIALAAPALAALERLDIDAAETFELRTPNAVLAVVAPQVRSVERIDAGHGAPARAIAIIDATGNAPQRLADAFSAGWIEWVVLLAGAAVPGAPEEWALVGEYPGPHPALLRLARLASRPRWRRHLLYSTSEYRSQWLAVFRAGCFGDQPALRVYVFQRVRPAAGPDGESRPTAGPAGADAPRVPGVPGPIRASPFQPAVRIRRHRLAALVTKLRRLVRVEWLLLRGRRRER